MTRYRFLPFALAMLVLTGFALIQTAAEDKPSGDRRADDRADKGTTNKGMGVYSGKITRVDSDKNTIVLGDIRRGGKGSGTGTDSGKTGSDSTADTGGKGKSGDRTMTFQVSDKARISLDGKDAKFADLRAGLYARVHTERKSGSGGTEKSGTGAGEVKANRDADKGDASGSAGRTRTATRVEAFTKAPSGTEKGSGATTPDR